MCAFLCHPEHNLNVSNPHFSSEFQKHPRSRQSNSSSITSANFTWVHIHRRGCTPLFNLRHPRDSKAATSRRATSTLPHFIIVVHGRRFRKCYLSLFMNTGIPLRSERNSAAPRNNNSNKQWVQTRPTCPFNNKRGRKQAHNFSWHKKKKQTKIAS